MPVTHKTTANSGDVISTDIWNEDHSITSLIPDANDTYTIGNSTNRWHIAYINQINMLNTPSYPLNIYEQATDSYPRLRIADTGLIEWSDGSGVPDVNLYRSGTNVLKTDDSFACFSLLVNGATVISSTRSMYNIQSISLGSTASSGVSIDNNGTIEIWKTSGDPYIDFKTSGETNYDARIQKQSDHSLTFEVGGAGSLKTPLTLAANGNAEFSGNVIISSTSPMLKLENTSSSSAFPRLEIQNPAITWRLGLLYTNNPTFFIYDATRSYSRLEILYDTSSNATQFKWYNSNGSSVMRLDIEGDLWIDGEYNTYSPEIPESWNQKDYVNFLKQQLNKSHPPRKDGKKICICGKIGVCEEHIQEFNEKYAINISSIAVVSAKLIVDLTNKIEQLEQRLSELEERLNQTVG